MTYNSCIWLTVKGDNIEQARERVAELSKAIFPDDYVVDAWPGDTEENDDE